METAAICLASATMYTLASVVRFKTIADNYGSLEEVQSALRVAGLESSNLILGSLRVHCLSTRQGHHVVQPGLRV